jgi:hypothetical protein
MLSTEGMQLPEVWQQTNQSSTPSATIKFASPRSLRDSPPPFTPARVPIVGAIEARLDFGTADASLRTVRTRTSVEVTEFALRQPLKTTLRGGLNIEPGNCYLVAKWREQYL